MESAEMTAGRMHILRLDPGEDVLISVEKFLAEQDICQAVVLGGYGTLRAYHLHWVTHNRIPSENSFGRGQDGIEILSMNGLVVESKPHIHITLSTEEGAFGGHLEQGCIAYVLCEIYFAEIEGVDLNRSTAHVYVPGIGEGDISRLSFGSR